MFREAAHEAVVLDRQGHDEKRRREGGGSDRADVPRRALNGFRLPSTPCGRASGTTIIGLRPTISRAADGLVLVASRDLGRSGPIPFGRLNTLPIVPPADPT